MTRWSGVGIGLHLLTLVVLGAPVDGPLRVLILDPFGRDVAPFSTAVSTFRTTLARELGEPVDFHEIPLDLARFEAEGESALVAFLADRMGSRPVDLVVPIGGAGVQFAARHRERLFPNTPVLIVARRLASRVTTMVGFVPLDLRIVNRRLLRNRHMHVQSALHGSFIACRALSVMTE